jgi:hypothetical protein
MARIKYVLDPALTFVQAKMIADRLYDEYGAAGKALADFADPFGKGPMGLTPDFVRAMPEYRPLKNEVDLKFNALRNFNAVYVKKFKKEISADIQARREAKLAYRNAQDQGLLK